MAALLARVSAAIYDYDEETAGEEGEEESLLSDSFNLEWARSMLERSFDDHLAIAEDHLRASFSVLTPWVQKGTKRLSSSASVR